MGARRSPSRMVTWWSPVSTTTKRLSGSALWTGLRGRLAVFTCSMREARICASRHQRLGAKVRPIEVQLSQQKRCEHAAEHAEPERKEARARTQRGAQRELERFEREERENH